MTRNRIILIAVVGLFGLVVMCGLTWYFVSPLFIDREVDESFPLEIPSAEEMAAMTETEIEEMRAEVEATAASMPDVEMDEPMPAENPVAVREGMFVDADAFHQGEGTATIYQLPDGSYVLRLEGFKVTNGPDLHMLLATGSAPTSQADLGEYVDLGSLKGNIGSQNYEIPAGVDISQYNSVVVYCLPFHVVFSVASLNS